MKESLAIVQSKLKDIAAASKVITVEHTVFPLAKDKEQHLVCSDVKTETGTLSKAVFTFADDQLTNIEARGNVQQSLAANPQRLGLWGPIVLEIRDLRADDAHSDRP